MNDLVERLYSEADFHVRNFFSTYIPSLGVGMGFRGMAIWVCNYFGINSGLPRSGAPADEFLRPLAVYATIAAGEKVMPMIAEILHRKLPSYAPKAAALVAWSGLWEAAEYLTPLAEVLKYVHPVPLGTVQDWLIDLSVVYFYGNGLKRRGPGQQ